MTTPRKFHRRDPLAVNPEALSISFDEAPAPTISVVNGTAIVSIDGPLDHKGGWFFDSYEAIVERFDAALAEPDVTRVILKLDSPGGEVAGLFETVRSMRASADAAGKEVIAYVDEACYSAAYAIACVADAIYLPETGGVGSIGCIQMLCDATAADAEMGLKFAVISSGAQKADGNPHVALSDDVIGRAQDRVSALAGMFFGLVSEARSIDVGAIQALEAGCFYGQDAISKGLADGIASLSDLINQPAASAAITPKEDTMRAIKNKAGRVVAVAAPAGVVAGDAAPEETEEEKAARLAKEAEEAAAKEAVPPAKDSEADAAKAGAEDDDEEEGEDPDAIGVAHIVSAVAEITGEYDPAKQVAALRALKVGAARGASLSHTDKVTALIEAGTKAGKIAPSMVAFWREQASKPSGLKVLASLVEKTPALVTTVEQPARTPAPGANGQGYAAVTTALTDEQRKMLATMQVNPDEVATRAVDRATRSVVKLVK